MPGQPRELAYPYPNEKGNATLEDMYNYIRNTKGSDAADAYLHSVNDQGGYSFSEPINGIPRRVQPEQGNDLLAQEIIKHLRGNSGQ